MYWLYCVIVTVLELHAKLSRQEGEAVWQSPMAHHQTVWPNIYLPALDKVHICQMGLYKETITD